MRKFRTAAPLALLCSAAVVVCSGSALCAAPQEPAEGAASSLTRIKEQLEDPPARLKPSGPLELRPTFRSGVEKHAFVPTLEEDLRRTFALTDFQRKYAEYAASCCGLNLGAVFKSVEQALDERRTRKIREQIARELADLKATRR